MEESAYLVGLYDAEGENSRTRIYLANSDTNLIKVALKWFLKTFRVKRSKIYIEIELPTNYKFRTPRFLKGYKIRKYINKGLTKPCYKIRIAFKKEAERFRNLKRVIYRKMVSEIKATINTDYPESVKICRLPMRYLQGVFDGDGNIRQVAMNSLVPLLFIETFLITAFRAPNTYRVRKGYTTTYAIRMDNKLILEKLQKMSAFRFNLKRKKAFSKLKLKQMQFKGNDKIVTLLRMLEDPKTLNEIYTMTGSECDQSVKNCVSLGFLKRYGRGNRYYPWKFVLSKTGSKFLRNYEKERKEYVISRLNLIQRFAPA